MSSTDYAKRREFMRAASIQKASQSFKTASQRVTLCVWKLCICPFMWVWKGSF